MKTYRKIQTVFKRDPENRYKTLLAGKYSLPEFEYLANNKWVWTEKVNGTNIRIIFNGERVTFRGKADKTQIPIFLTTRLNEVFLPQLDLFKANFADGVCLYGEGYGVKIQKEGGNYRPNQDFVLFDVKIGDWWLQRMDVVSIASDLGIECVPIVGEGTLLEMVQMAQSGFTSTWGDFQAEGLVARPATELKTRSGERIITKIKHKDFG